MQGTITISIEEYDYLRQHYNKQREEIEQVLAEKQEELQAEYKRKYQILVDWVEAAQRNINLEVRLHNRRLPWLIRRLYSVRHIDLGTIMWMKGD